MNYFKLGWLLRNGEFLNDYEHSITGAGEESVMPMGLKN
ncbi:hypothetical protein LFAB_14080 [Lactiplantibacillus fabifermentans T30PCM01]|uniref:Uncharacterized protein n=1 Tax=Lactiplantibacillus fabifermentans T30PCM01 TaxID=1400520 RepID=W6T595_9LACO|nr:hypothetical protein LFAB_14080 [Lactiplantibacillus fabifermentans T30PCM01]